MSECWDTSQERLAFKLKPLAGLTRRNITASLDRLESVVLETA